MKTKRRMRRYPKMTEEMRLKNEEQRRLKTHNKDPPVCSEGGGGGPGPHNPERIYDWPLLAFIDALNKGMHKYYKILVDI